MAEPALSEYHAKRNFGATPEPAGEVAQTPDEGNRWVIQEHAASRLHYDFRLEAGGVLISWAVPKGPSYDPSVKRLAVKVEDHPLDYREFEGVIPKGNYGAGSVIVWDEGTYRNLTEKNSKPVPVTEAVAHGHVSVWLEGEKLMGGWSLSRFGSESTSWALVKRKDEYADAEKDITRDAPRSVKSGLTVEEVGRDPDAQTWVSNRPATGDDRASPAEATSRPASSDPASSDPGSSGLDSSGRARSRAARSGEASSGEAGSGPARSGGAGSGRANTGRAGGTDGDQQLEPAHFVAPMLAQSDPPGVKGPWVGKRDDWLFEPKFDGLRCIAVRNGREVSLFSRNELSFTARFPTVVNAIKALPAGNIVIDGELVGMIDRRPDFGALQEGKADVEYWVFDMPWLLGQDLRHLPIEERKGLLAKAAPEGGALRLVPTLQGDPDELFATACQRGDEGLVAKRAGSPYRDGRSPDWRKLKCECRQDLVIGGFTAPHGSRDSFGALLLGYWDGADFAYAGKVGTGFSRATLHDLYKRLSGLETPSSPFGAGAVERGARWVAPTLVAEVAFSNWTRDGRLRQPSFIRLRPDKDSREVVREECASRPGDR